MPRRRYSMRSSKSWEPQISEPPSQRELLAVREIVHAFLRADRPEDVFQFALDRASPIVGAAFASVYLVEGASELMRLVAAHNWPDRHRPWLSEARVRVGFGPSGEAASERRTIEISDVFADPDLEDWHDVAREMGFRAIVALPLQTASRVLGTVAFYFNDLDGFSADKRGLLRIVADQMAATAEKAGRVDDLRRANAALVEANAELERQFLAVADARRTTEVFLAAIANELREPQTSPERLAFLVDTMLEYTALQRGAVALAADEFDPRVPLRDAMRAATGVPENLHLLAEEPAHALPLLTSDRAKITRILASFLSDAIRFTAGGAVRASVSVNNGRIEYRVGTSGTGFMADASIAALGGELNRVESPGMLRDAESGLRLAVSRGVARLLGGDIEYAWAAEHGLTLLLFLPVEQVPPGVLK